MRVLMATTAGTGHFGPMVPFARALRDAGHHVLVAAPASFAPVVERAGFLHHPVADAAEDELGAVFARLPHVSWEEANAVVVGEVFAGLGARAALPGMRDAFEEWRPDLVVRETSEFASHVVAEARGVPAVQVAVGLAGFEERFLPVVEAPLAELGSTGALAGLRSCPRVSLSPETLDGPAAGRHAVDRFREDGGAPPAALPDWWPGPSDPLVYVTFGTVAAGLGLFPRLYLDVVAAVADLPVRVLLTTGEAGDPDALRPLPANVHVERFWPQAEVMPHASALIGHGGFGTTLAGLTAGVPTVILPLFADQPFNADRVQAIGAGLALEGGPAAVGGLPAALRRVLDDDRYRTRAKAVADEIARLPPVAAAVPLLERTAGR